jgi:DNA-binding NarL/FixJ family response regulator
MDSVRTQAEQLRVLLQSAFGVQLAEEEFAAAYGIEIRRLGHASLGEELGSMLLADCWEFKRSNGEITMEVIRRLMNNAQHRLSRTVRGPNAKRTIHPKNPGQQLESSDSGPAEAAERRDLVAKTLSELTPSETLVLSLLTHGASSDQIVESIGVSRSTVFRMLERIKARLGEK